VILQPDPEEPHVDHEDRGRYHHEAEERHGFHAGKQPCRGANGFAHPRVFAPLKEGQ